MGVTGLWKLIDQSGKEVLIETLENKVLAIDISIWLHQVIKGFQDRKGSALQNAHLLGLFNRLCKLLFYRIKPVFIFDGAVPFLKRDTIAKRQQGRTKILKEVERIQELLAEAMNKEKIVHQALGSNGLDSLTSIAQEKKNRKGNDDNEGIFHIPDYLSPVKAIDDSCQAGSSSDWNTSLSENDSFDDSNLQHYYNLNLQNIDVTSAHFKNLPADVRIEILADIKEMRKQNSWGRLHEMPTQSDNFSSFQMKRLLKRRQVQVGLEEAEKELEGKSLTLSELETFLSEQGIVTAEQNAKSRINSDASTRFLLVKDLKKAIEKAAMLELKKNEPTNEETTSKGKEEVDENNTEKDKENMVNDKSSTSFESLSEEEDEESDKNDIDLQLAIELSLNQTDVYNDNDYMASKANLNKEQKDMFKNATGSARDYLLKYGLIKNLDLSQVEESKIIESKDETINIKHNKSLLAEITQEKSQTKNLTDQTDLRKFAVTNIVKQSNEQPSKENESIAIMSDDSDNDSDFLEVTEVQNCSDNILMHKTNKIQIHLDPSKKIKPEDDLFADIFLDEHKKPSTETILDESHSVNIINSNKLPSELNASMLDDRNEKQENVSHILEKLQKEAFEVQKLSLDDIKIENSVIEILESQQNIDEESKTNNLVIEIKDSQDNFELQSIEVPDSQEVQPSKSELETLENDLPQKSLELELSETQESFVLKMDDESDIEIINSQNFDTNDRAIPKDITKNSEIIEILDESITVIQKYTSPKKKDLLELTEKTTEIIEILDDSITPLHKTPSKPKIQSYFKAEYIIKKTPSKDNEEQEDETVPKVPSPYFIKKTPTSSNKKRKLEIEESVKRTSKVSKSLFENNEISEKEKELKAIKEASEALKNTKSKEQLEEMVTELDQEKKELEVEKNRQDRMGLTITEKMTNDCMDLLKLFGIPYIVAPMEAEAQCAFLEAIELTDGTITDDSDIWLFGGRTVYKNFFDKQKHVLEFKIDQIQRDYSLDRERLIQLAFLVGSDYTIGIKGIGAVTALEILAAFPNTPAVEKETSKVMSLLSSLRKFRDWFTNTKTGGCDSIKVKLKNKLKNIEIINGFPSLAVAEAYLYPRVDDSKEPFTWGTPELEEIQKFAKKNLGWTNIKTAETLGPVLRRLEQKKSQTSIKNFFVVKSVTYQKDLKLSKRVEKAVKKMSTNYNTEDDDEVSQLNKKKPKRNLKKKPSNETAENEMSINKTKPKKIQNRKRKPKTDELVRPDGPSTLIKVFGESPEKKTKLEESKLDKKPCIPQTKLVIPQRERDINEMNKRKETASALFKRSRAVAGKKKNLE